MACCEPGSVWEGEPTGSETQIGGLPAYVAKPQNATSKAALLLSDVFGWKKKNPRLIADEFAKAGYLAVLPDFFDGKPLDPEWDKPSTMSWFSKANRRQEKLKLVEAVADDLRANYGITKLGTEGFCWGGLYVALLCSSGKADAGIITHGSWMEPADIEALTRPTLFLCAEEDHLMPEGFREEIEEIIAKKPFPTGLKLYPGTAHGFSVRGDKTNPDIAAKAEDALKAAIQWLDTHLTEE